LIDFISRFPEELYQTTIENRNNYITKVINGYTRAKSSRVFIGGICRDVEPVLPYTINRINKLANLFKDFSVHIFENDSTDNTKELLKYWGSSDKINVYCSNQNKPKHEQNVSTERMIDMAGYRNQYLNILKDCMRTGDHYDYSIFLDMDLEGGFSYDGIMNTIGTNYWSAVGSNGLCYQDGGRLFYDTWAYRELDNDKVENVAERNLLLFNRGEKMEYVFSCFGGLAIYKPYIFQGHMEYKGDDCDHPSLHKQIREDGNPIHINPSQITVYSPSQYVLNKEITDALY